MCVCVFINSKRHKKKMLVKIILKLFFTEIFLKIFCKTHKELGVVKIYLQQSTPKMNYNN